MNMNGKGKALFKMDECAAMHKNLLLIKYAESLPKPAKLIVV